MKLAIKTLDNAAAGEMAVNESVYNVEPRSDILARMVNYQLAKKQQGTHDTKQIAEIRGGGRKPWKQKGTGNARQGSIRSPQWRGGATIFGPTPRSHAFDLPKKVRALAMRMALSVKHRNNKLIVVDTLSMTSPKTKDLLQRLQKLGVTNALFVGGSQLDSNFAKAASNIPHIDVLPVQGANVYDILRRDVLVMSKDAVLALDGRLSKYIGRRSAAGAGASSDASPAKAKNKAAATKSAAAPRTTKKKEA